jgi:hypothetical protein
MSKNFENNAGKGENGNEMCEEKEPQKSSMDNSNDALDKEKAKKVIESFDNINENTPDYDYNIISKYNFL